MAREMSATVLAVAAVVVLTLVAVVALQSAERSEDELRIARAAEDVASTITTEMERIADLAEDLAVAAQLVEELDELDAARYDELLDRFELARRFPAVTGVSFTERLTRDELEERFAAREPGGPSIELFGDAGEDLLRVITMSYPSDPNAAAVGVDLGSRPESRVAHDTAATTRSPVLSSLTRIVQFSPDEPGVSLHAPIVVHDEVPATIGLVASVPSLLAGIQPLPADVEVAISDPASTAFPDPVVLAADGSLAELNSDAEVEVAGQRWVVTVTATESFSQPVLRRGSTLLGLGGAVAAVLVGLLVHALATRERHASEQVRERTAEVSRVNEQLIAVNAELGEANVALEAAGRNKDDFLAAVSHELRTPLTVIRGFTESLHRLRPTGSDLVAMLDPIDRNVRRLDSLVGDLLTLVSLDAGALVSHREPVHLATFLSAAPVELAGLPEDAVHVEVVGDPVADVDPNHLERVVTNLLVNAARHGQPPIELRAVSRGDDVEVEVRDHGPGIEVDDTDVVFERFARAPGQEAVTGTGLGLAIVRELVALANGSVTYSHAEPGARFTVRLPGAR